jgi:hypothetical protein
VDLLELATAAASSEDGTAALPQLLHWLHRAFTQVNQQQQQQLLQQQQEQPGLNSTTTAGDGGMMTAAELLLLQELFQQQQQQRDVQQQLRSCILLKCGTAMQLAVLLAGLLRGIGFLTRSVW